MSRERDVVEGARAKKKSTIYDERELATVREAETKERAFVFFIGVKVIAKGCRRLSRGLSILIMMRILKPNNLNYPNSRLLFINSLK